MSGRGFALGRPSRRTAADKLWMFLYFEEYYVEVHRIKDDLEIEVEGTPPALERGTGARQRNKEVGVSAYRANVVQNHC